MEFCNSTLSTKPSDNQCQQMETSYCSTVHSEEESPVCNKWVWLTELIAFFFFFFVITWIMLYSLAPPLLLTVSKQVDTAKVLIASLLIAFGIVILLGVLRYVVNVGSNTSKLNNQLEKCITYCNK